jgi:hypothetical protein
MTTRDGQPVRLELSRAEAWLVHHVMLDSLGLAGPRGEARTPTPCELRILEQLEDGPPLFTPSCRSSTDLPETFTGTCVHTGSEVVLDDGEHTVEVVDTSVLGGEAQLGREYEVPLEACEKPSRYSED